jgi:short-subunit dehydrogenase
VLLLVSEQIGPDNPVKMTAFCLSLSALGSKLPVTQKFLPLIRENQGRLVQISSVAGLLSSSGGNPYSATKYAVESLNDALRLELHPWKVSVSAINPAFVKVHCVGDV